MAFSFDAPGKALLAFGELRHAETSKAGAISFSRKIALAGSRLVYDGTEKLIKNIRLTASGVDGHVE